MATKRVTVSDLAAEFHIARSVARRYLKDKGVSRAPDLTYAYPEAARAIRASKDFSKVLLRRNFGQAGGKLTSIDLDDDIDLDDEEEVDPLDCTPSAPKTDPNVQPAESSADNERRELLTARTEAQREQGRKLRLANDLAEGRSIKRDALTETLIAIVAAARSSLLALGDRVAPKIVGLTDADEIAEIVNAEAEICLGELADAAELEGAILQ